LKNNTAFTFIELLVVITLISILTTTGVFYFSQQVSYLSLTSTLEEFSQKLTLLDRQILEREIVDYDVFFESSLSSD
jgi:prepilin-type N-terminal cleavage/methylation domain-containing protein